MIASAGDSGLAWLISGLVRICKIAGIILVLVLVAFVIYVTPVYQSHNRAAREVLSLLLSEPLPANATVLRKDWEVGGYEGAGNLCEAAAFIVIKTRAPRGEVLAYYKDIFPKMGQKVDSDFYIAPLDDLPPLTSIPGNIEQMAASMTPDEREIAYVIWGIRPVDELSWDIRGW